jgi:CHAD domain-containing protein
MPAMEPDQPTTTVTVAIFQALFAVMMENVEGVRLGLDPECLHDFRVAVRRTRSALREIKGVLPRNTAKRFQRAFSRLARTTGPTRDLDVFLLKFAGYEASLPDELAPHLPAVKEAIEGLRHSAHRRLVEDLESDHFASLLREWPALLDSVTPATSPARGRRPIAEVAERRIARARQRAITRAGAIEPSSPDRDLHRLRLACKRLRYLQEFFRSLFPAEEIGRRIETLKSLQDILGDFNDLSVQRQTLCELTAGPRLSQEVRTAIAALDELLAELRQEDRRHVIRWVVAWESGSLVNGQPTEGCRVPVQPEST